MIKNLFLALCAASLVGTASAGDNPFTVQDTLYDTLVTGYGTYTQLMEALTAHDPQGDFAFIRFGDKNGDSATVIFSENDQQYTPAAITLEFANASLVFRDLVTLKPDPETGFGPGMVAGYIIGHDAGEPIIAPGNLTISVDKTAVDEWLSTEELDVVATWSLLDDSARIEPTKGASVTFQLIDGEGHIVVPQGGEYAYDDTHKYTNAGIIWNAGDLAKKQIALHFVPGGAEEWGGGQFNVLALGENYTPVPEPATGTLSLLALAGLAARRRRK